MIISFLKITAFCSVSTEPPMISKVLQLSVGFQLCTTVIAMLRYTTLCSVCRVDSYPTLSFLAPHAQAIILKTTLII